MIDEEQFIKDMEFVDDYAFSFKTSKRRRKLYTIHTLLKAIAVSYETKNDFLRKVVRLEQIKDLDTSCNMVRNTLVRLEKRKILKFKITKDEGRSKMQVEAGEYFDLFFSKLSQIIHEIDVEAEDKVKNRVSEDEQLTGNEEK